MHKGILLIALTAAGLAGCPQEYAKRDYVDPTEGPSAYLTLRNGTSGRADVAVYDNAARCSGRSTLPDLLLGEERTIRIPAGKPFAFSFRYQQPNTNVPHYCQVTVSFDTAPDARYLAELVKSPRACTVEISQVDLLPDGRLRPSGGVNAQRRVLAKEPADASGAFCLPLQ